MYPHCTVRIRLLYAFNKYFDFDLKYIVVNADRVRPWLQYLFHNHKEFIRLKQQNQLYVDENAIQLLGSNLELAEIDSGLVQCMANEAKKIEEAIERDDDGLTDATATSGFSQSHFLL